MAQQHEVDFRIVGDDMQFVEVELDPGESAIAEAGSMMSMTPDIDMETIFGDGSGQQRSGVVGALLGAGKRLITGESLFMTVFTNPGRVWLQSLPFSRMADRIYKAAPAAGGSRREGGSILGGLGDLLDGDSQ